MRTRGRNRQSEGDVKKQALEYARRAKYLARVVKADNGLLERINTLEREIRITKLDHRYKKDFYEKVVKELGDIHYNLEKRYLRRISRLELLFCLIAVTYRFFVFLGFYSISIPENAYRVGSLFYTLLGGIAWLCLACFFAIYFLVYKLLMINVVLPFLRRIKSSSERNDNFFRLATQFFFFSFLWVSYGQLVDISAMRIPRIFTPSMPVIVLISSVWTSFEQIAVSTPILAIGSALTILTIPVWLLRKVLKRLQIS